MTDNLAEHERNACRLGDPQAETAELLPRALLDAVPAVERKQWLDAKRLAAIERLKQNPSLEAQSAVAAELIYYEFLLRQEANESPEWDRSLQAHPRDTQELAASQPAGESKSTLDRDGSQIGDYDIQQEIGRGGMGVIFRAVQRSLSRVVALKMLQSGKLSDPVAIERFIREALAVSRLNHPNIVQIFGIGQSYGRPFIAFEFVDGSSLSERIGGTPLEVRLAVSILEPVARGIQYANERRIIHRDLKPANVLLSKGPTGLVPKVTDFGAAKTIDVQHAQRRTQVVGTPAYMAPEQLEGTTPQITVRTDVYGLGAILYECLTGVPPFRGLSVAEVLRRVADELPTAPRVLNPLVPRNLETICLKCLSKDPQRRYESAAALADDLKRFESGKPVLARPIGPFGRTAMWCRRKPGTAFLAAALLVALLAGLSGVTIEWRRAEAHRLRAEAEWVRTEAARKSAVASDIEAQELLSELMNSNEAVAGRTYFSDATIIESLLRAELHCKKLLQNHPEALQLRIALSNVYRHLMVLYGNRGQIAAGDSVARRAQALWEPLADEKSGDATARDWLALTCFWQSADDVPRYVQTHLRALTIWQSLVDEGGDPNYMTQVCDCRRRLTDPLLDKSFRNACLPLFQENRAALRRLVDNNPSDRNVRKRLALICFGLGEIYAKNGSTGEAAQYWREACEQENALLAQRSDDLIDMLSLATASSRLIQGGASDRHYQRAVALFAQSVKRLQALLPGDPAHSWVPELLSETCCSLVVCHVSANQTREAAEASNQCADLLATLVAKNQTDRELVLGAANTLVRAAQRLTEAKQTPAALRITRNAAALFAQLDGDPGDDPGFLRRLGCDLIRVSVLAKHLGDAKMSLQQAELSRRKLEEDWTRATPADTPHDEVLSNVWDRCAKARWASGDRKQALAALRELTAIRKRLFRREPSKANQMLLTRCYNRLAFYGSRSGDLRTAAEAILERTQLWPGDPVQLGQSAEDFETLADYAAARVRGQISNTEGAEREHYLAESRRIRQLARR